MVFHKGGYIIFGGYIGREKATSTIARFDESTRTWSKLGEVLTPKSLHAVIYTGQSFLVIGGVTREKGNRLYRQRTEKCDMKNDSITCQYHSSTLENFYFWPATVLVNETFDQ